MGKEIGERMSSETANWEEVDDYLKEVGRYPLLTQNDEVELGRKIQAGNNDARRKMTESNLRLVVAVAKKYGAHLLTSTSGSAIGFIDLIQEGNVGLMTAVDKFDPELGYKFSTIAYWWIRQAVTRALANTGRTVRIPAHMVGLLRKWNQKKAELRQSLGREPADDLVDDALNLSPSQRHARASGSAGATFPMNRKTGDDDDEFEFAIAVTDGTEGILEHRCSMVPVGVMTALHWKERKILGLRCGMDGEHPHTLEGIATKMSITRERVRQIEAQALRKMSFLLEN
jgi:RNA polymerase primary sigma factor